MDGVPRSGAALADSSPCTLSGLEPDAFAAVCAHLRHQDVAALAASTASLRQAVATNDRMWSSLFHHQFPNPWQRLTQSPPGGPGQGGAAVAPGGWRDTFLATHTTCQQLRSTGGTNREWTTDTTPVHLAALHGSGVQRLTLVAQGATVELRCAPSSPKSVQFYGHGARVSAAALLELGGAVRRVGLVSASHDQTVRLWAANVDAESYGSRSVPLTLLTPTRTLRGHQEAVTSLQLVPGGTGVTIAATGSKDRTVRLWGLAPLLLSPVQKPQIATLRGHGGPVTCLALAASASRSGSSGSLFSGSLDSRVKAWDPWTAACTGTAKCAAPVTTLQPATSNPLLQPHALLAAGGSAVQLLDARSMRAVAAAALVAERPEHVHCFAQQGWDLAIGGSAGASVFDLRALPPASCAPASSNGAGGSRGGHERMRLATYARPVTSIHIDRHKVVTATDRYGEGPLRVWSVGSGDCLVELDSCLAQATQGNSPQPGSEQAGGQLQAQPGQAAEPGAAPGQAVGRELTASRPHGQYRRGWEGITALCCRGAVVVSGSSEGAVCERDFSRGGLPELEEGAEGAGSGALVGKFWQYGAA